MFVSVSKDHSRVVVSPEHDRRYFGGAAGPLTGSKATEYTGPLCPMSLRVVLPFFSRILARDVAKMLLGRIRYLLLQRTILYPT
jgi:hypothetical protein